MDQQSGSPPSEAGEARTSRSAFGRIVGFVLQHPVGAIQLVVFSLLAIIVLQNLEPTSIDVLFWSFAAIPKLLLIFASMLAGAAAWEIVRRWIRR